MSGPDFSVTVVGGGLAGCEAALQLGSRGIATRLMEMRPTRPTAAHRTGDLAEIVCSNSLKSTVPSTGSGLLKLEMARLGAQLLTCAQKAAVPAGAALAVDAAAFSREVTTALEQQECVTVVREEVHDLPLLENHLWILATGPLTSPTLIEAIGQMTGQPALHFYDAIAPTVTLESLDLDVLYRAARYDKGDADYLNAALNKEQYEALYEGLISSEKAQLHSFDRSELFDGCQPIEAIAASGPRSLAFGPLRPVGLHDPRTGKRPHAVVQLRQENLEGTLYGLVGFQTQLKHGEQKRVFRQIPGLEKAEFVRLGQLHRNFFCDSPRCLNPDFSLKQRPDVFLAGQMTGVEGYVESMASGLLTARQVAARLRGRTVPALPMETMMGSLLNGFLFDTTAQPFSPMNVNFGLVPDLTEKVRGKQGRKLAKSDRALVALEQWLQANPDDDISR
jgi:methylenetetrahydrofolate--tRNA-(uracil-5-)-methyltransferase|nr:methylenetetrahydrofolate--tRNA-(uracil(54)-C(5))-methyltransferase (FADH(2)-oxidizing) TrmFO [Candidatus Krumholzibacteria bacterium]